MVKPVARPSAAFKYKPLATKPPAAGHQGKKGPRLAPIVMGGAVLYVAATYVSMLVFKSKGDTTAYTKDQQQSHQPQDADGSKVMGLRSDQLPRLTPDNYDTSRIWGTVANSYDKEIGMDETVMGMGVLRWWLVSQAKGDVLEVAAGTGRNFGYYRPSQVASLVVTDDHASMLSQAEAKFAQYKEKFHDTFVAFQTANVDQHLHASQADNKEQASQDLSRKFDTVIDTFGLCSCHDPAEALVAMADACKSSESRILLLEHGRSHYDWLNRLLDANVDKHVQKWGCWWNRGIMDLFQDDRVKDKVEVLSSSRWHFGTTCYIVARPKRSE
ncbi:hypothetical protein DM01DRAFT_1339205 [Hesseltinella vesiculosa]|uniref:S-adenosyl-L-methionine-dependent methyltransferase n=1 Tax=Hesseltinella vesiculosa TaxID=101127 RepID=A0A1X2G7Q8_9FUNG|nr:hypothetical protein DM01DRAFT_1339205 [Hesseltinella vesiculosa]